MVERLSAYGVGNSCCWWEMLASTSFLELVILVKSTMPGMMSTMPRTCTPLTVSPSNTSPKMIAKTTLVEVAHGTTTFAVPFA
jgi:hypothetical protein